MNSAVILASIIASIGIAYDTLEFYLKRDAVLTKFYNWRIVRSRYYILINRPSLSLIFDLLFERKTFLTLVIIHGIAALAFPLAFYLNLPLTAGLAFIVLLVHCLVNIRIMVGRDGADQMQNIIWAGLFAYALPINEAAKLVALGFIAAQLILSYLTSGIYKMISPVWRNGSAIHLICRMATYCPFDVARILKKRFVSILLSWLTILFEILSPLLLLFGEPGAIIFMAMGICFHIGIALTMGLTTFVFSFLATYPIIYQFVKLL